MKYMLFLSLIVLTALTLIAGCANVPHAVTPPHEYGGPGNTPPSLAHVATTLDWFIGLSVLTVGIGIGLFFLLPGSHSTSTSLIFLGAGVEVSSLVTRASLWAVPYFVVGVVVLGIGALIFEIFLNRAKLAALAEHAASDAKAMTTASIASIEAATQKTRAETASLLSHVSSTVKTIETDGKNAVAAVEAKV